MSPGNIQKQHDEDEDDEPFLRYPEHANDRNLIPSNSTITAASTLIPKPYSARSTVAPIQSKKNNIPSGPQPRDHFYVSPLTRDRDLQHLQKKRVIDEAWDLTSPNGKRQNTNTRSRGQGNTFKGNLGGESYEAARETQTCTNRSIMGRLKSEQLKESLAGGSSPPKMRSATQEQEETVFEIPLERYQEWTANRRGLDATGSGDDVAIESGSKTTESPKKKGRRLRMENGIKETQWDGKNPLPLTRFRRGKFVLLDDTTVSIILDSSKNFRVYEGGRELEGYGFPSKQIKYLFINHERDYVAIILDRRDNVFPNGEQIWWKLAAPCPGLEKTFSNYTRNNTTSLIKPTAFIEERENKFKSLKKEDPIYQANPNPQEAPQRKHLDILNSDQPKEPRTVRNTRSRNAQAGKRVTTIEVEDVDAYSISPTGPKYHMAEAERDLPPLVWPLSGKKRVTVEFQDLERLQEAQFLNDNIINFYLRYLEEELARENPAVAQQTYWFNTFFYERLSQKTTDRKANLRALMKWTARVDLFAKQYVIIPINENAHWYLAIICNLPHLERKLQSSSGQDHQGEEATTISTPDFPGEEDEISSEVELPSMAQTALASPDRMEIDGPNPQRPVTAEGQLLSEFNHHEPENLPDRIPINEPAKGDEDEWPNEEGLEGVSDQYISELELPHNHEQVQNGGEEVIIPTHNHDKKRGKKQKGQPIRIKKPPKPVGPNSPTIIILDSLGNYGHSRTFSLLREYLEEEALDKKKWEAIRRTKIEGLYAIVPQQPNFCDCGVYLLYYVERFLQRPEEFTQEFLQKRDTKAHFDSDQFSSMRQKLYGLIEELHHEQHNVPAKTDVSNHHSIAAQTRTDSRRDLSEETQEVQHSGGGPRSIERSTLTKENGHSPRRSSQDIDMVNIIQSRRFTPERDGGPRSGLWSTSSRRISHVEIPNKERTNSPPSLRSSSSPEHIPITKNEMETPWYHPLSAQESTSPSERDEYAVSVD